ncbi:MAG: hypothetical protein GF384_04690 [Elusimicrobia bacterium]|nr:hypothetical protein [Elusimicrobiota bacterium]MBD3412127.1 hypothetical protein [Elusimicrobiota bacterium]
MVKARARRQMGYLLRTDMFLQNLSVLSGRPVEKLHHHDTLGYCMNRINPDDLRKVRTKMIRQLLRKRVLEKYRLLRQYYMIAIDMTGYLVFQQQHCPQCLRKEHEGKVVYWYHPVVEAKLVTANGFALSIESEFVENSNPKATKQDCELKAMYRLIDRLKKNFPQLQMCLLLDGLYANGSVLERVAHKQWKCIITFKEGCMSDVWKNYQGLKKLQATQTGPCVYNNVIHTCQWVNGVEYQGKNLSVLECHTPASQDPAKPFVWLTDIEVRRTNYTDIVKGGRSRWTIENQGFNMQKNGGYRLEHAYSEHPVGMQNFYLLLQIAHIINQLMEKGSLLKDKIHSVLGSIHNIARQLLEELRTIKIDRARFNAFADLSFQIRFDTS